MTSSADPLHDGRMEAAVEEKANQLPEGGMELLKESCSYQLSTSEQSSPTAQALNRLKLLHLGEPTDLGRLVAGKPKRGKSAPGSTRTSVETKRKPVAKNVANKKATRKTVANKASTRKTVANKASTRKTAAKKASKKKTVAKKKATRKTAAKKASKKKTVAKKKATKKKIKKKSSSRR